MEVFVMIFGPGILALAALGGAIVLATRLAKASPSGRSLLKLFIILLIMLAFGIGTCYVVVFSSFASGHR